LLLQRWLREQMKSFAFASVTLFGREKVGVLMRAANESAVDILAIQREFDLDTADVLSYDDKRRNVSRRVRIADGKLAAASLAGDVAAERWLRAFLEEQRPVAELGRQLLQPSATPPQGFRERGKIVCNCFNIAATDIADVLSEAGSVDAAASLDLLKQRLKCGTNCGSCLPELKAAIVLSAKTNSLHA
jgi:assimilatory nitrate reductase catalytic subunit